MKIAIISRYVPLAAAIFIVFAASCIAHVKAAIAPKPAPSPFAFSLPDTHGRIYTASNFNGKPITLFFFCGCDRCHNTANAWTDAVAGEGMQPASAKSKPAAQTIIVYAGAADEARQFAADTGIGKLHPVILIDPNDTLRRRFATQTCPRVFVLDTARKIVYASEEVKDDVPFSGMALASHALVATRRVENSSKLDRASTLLKI